MIVLALVLLLVVALVVAGVVLSPPTVHDLSVFRIVVPVTDAGMFLAGAAATLLAVIAVILVRSGLRRSRARRKEVRAARAGSTRTSAPAVNASGSTSRTSDSGPRTSTGSGRTPVTTPSSSGGSNAGEQPSTDSAERARLLAEADALTRDDPPR